jgi:hypothetical protein
MISSDHRTVFVHVPKTGGQSIEMVFLRKLGLTWAERASLLLRPNPDPARGPRRLAHLYAGEYVRHGYLGAADFAAFFKFAVVRNPWARAVSEYKFAYQPRGMPFAAFLGEVVARRRHVLEERHIAPQVRFVAGDDGAVIVDRVLRFESLAADFAAVSREIFGAEEPLPLRNVSRDRTDYRAFYNDAGRGLIAEKYRDDIEAFGYEFDDG